MWEQLHNPDFNRVQFDTFEKEHGSNSRLLCYACERSYCIGSQALPPFCLPTFLSVCRDMSLQFLGS
jgi:hypothetical protein